jgi:hypothetical protein
VLPPLPRGQALAPFPPLRCSPSTSTSRPTQPWPRVREHPRPHCSPAPTRLSPSPAVDVHATSPKESISEPPPRAHRVVFNLEPPKIAEKLPPPSATIELTAIPDLTAVSTETIPKCSQPPDNLQLRSPLRIALTTAVGVLAVPTVGSSACFWHPRVSEEP